MKVLFLISLVFMVSCQQQAELEAMMTDSDVVEKSFESPVILGDELFDVFDISSEDSQEVLSSNGAHFRSNCTLDSSGLYYEQSVYISQAGAGENEFKMTLIRYFSQHSSCSNPMEFYHASSMYVNISDSYRPVSYGYEFDLSGYDVSDRIHSNDDCDYSRDITDSGCVFDIKNGGFEFEVIDSETIRFNGRLHRK